MKITVEEIAKLAGVSKATVSRVLNNKPDGVGEQTRLRVQQIIESTGYVHETVNNSGAMKSGCVALIVPDISNPFFADIAKTVEARAKENGYIVVLCNTDFSEESEKRYIVNLVAKKMDGIILITAGERSSEEHQRPEKYGIPMVLLDRKFLNERKWLGVYSDNSYATFHSCEMLINNGSREIAYLSGGLGVSTAIERLDGYKAALEHYHIPFRSDLIKLGDYTVESGYNAVMELEQAGVIYSGILAANDLMAFGALNALKELSRKVPDEVEVVGFDNIAFSRYSDPPLTTIQQPSIEMGCKACDMLLKLIKGEKVRDSIRLQAKMLVRKTTR